MAAAVIRLAAAACTTGDAATDVRTLTLQRIRYDLDGAVEVDMEHVRRRPVVATAPRLTQAASVARSRVTETPARPIRRPTPVGWRAGL